MLKKNFEFVPIKYGQIFSKILFQNFSPTHPISLDFVSGFNILLRNLGFITSSPSSSFASMQAWSRQVEEPQHHTPCASVRSASQHD